MRKFFDLTKKAAAVLLAAIILTTPLKAAEHEPAATELNAAEISYEQAELCRDQLLDGFEADETVRAPLSGCAIYADGTDGGFSHFEGTSRLMLSGADAVGADLSFLKHPSLSDCRSVAVAVFIKPDEDGAAYSVTLTASGTDAAVTATGAVRAGAWVTVYLPFKGLKPGQLVSVRIMIEREGGGDIEAALDCLHTAKVDGMPENLTLFASDFSCAKGKISYSGKTLVFGVNGTEGYIESSVCNYMITEKTNTLAITIDNAVGASSAVLECKINGVSRYNETDSYERKLDGGKKTYYFRIGCHRGDNVLNSFRLTFKDKLKGEIKIEKIELTSYRYPTSYPGELTVSAAADRITVKGSVASYPAGSSEIRLYRLAPEEDEERFEELDVTPYMTAAPSKTFSFELPRYDGDTDNALFKYFAVFYSDTAFYAAPAAYAPLGIYAFKTVGTRGVSPQSDLSALSLAEPDTVYLRFDSEKIFGEDGEPNEEYFSQFDGDVGRCESEGFGVAAIISFPGGLPDISGEEALSSFVKTLTAISEKYGDLLQAVIPCGDLNGQNAIEKAGSEDRAARYAAALARTCAYVLSPRGLNVILPLGTDGTGCEPIRFLQMLGEEDLKNINFCFTLTGSGAINGARTVSNHLASNLLYNGKARSLFAEAPFPSSEEELIRAFYGAAEYCAGVYFYGALEDNAVTDLFRAIDSADGAARAEAVMKESGNVFISLVYPHTASYTKVYRNIELSGDAPKGSVSILFDGRVDENQIAYDACHGIYQGAVNTDPAAELAFDFSTADRGKAVFNVAETGDNGAFYVRLYADYLPAEESKVELTVTLYGENGCAYGTCALSESEPAALCIKTDGVLGAVRRVAFYVRQNENGTLSTPRICVLGIYAADAESEQTVTEVPETEPPKPETQVFVTETEAQTEETPEEKDGTGRLLLITLCVMLFMFAACGAVIFILKKINEKKQV